MFDIIHKIPIITTIIAIVFFVVIGKHWYRKKHNSPHLLWWTLGVLFYGISTFTESVTPIYGWNIYIFKMWYIFGALLGGAPLAQGTVYLLMKKKTADILALILTVFLVVASLLIILSPVNTELALREPHRLTGKVLEWPKVRLFAVIINTYATIFLIGGATYSAIIYAKNVAMKYRFYGNVFIAVGAILPGIGGSFAAFGHTEVLYVTESFGLLFIFIGYLIIKKDKEEIK